jgi:hypothetical protein
LKEWRKGRSRGKCGLTTKPTEIEGGRENPRSVNHISDLAGIGLGLLVRLLRYCRFYTYAITAVIVLVTGGKAANENRARSIERLIAWEKRQSQVLEGEVKRQSKRLERKAKREVKKVKEALPG